MIKFEEPVLMPRLALRVFAPSDEDALFAVHVDAESAKYLSRATRSRSEVRQTISRRMGQLRFAEPGDGLILATTTRPAGTLVGKCSLWLRTGREAEIGFATASAHQGKGYAREAAMALISFARSTELVDMIYARVRKENTASIRLLQRLGMTRREHRETPEDHIIYQIRPAAL